MKKIIALMTMVMFGMTIMAGGLLAKPAGAGSAGKGKAASEHNPHVEKPTTNVEHAAKNKGQEKKLEERIKVRGMNMKFDDPPVLKEGRVLIPLRAIMNGLGAEVEWDGETKTVTITRDDKVVIIDLVTGEVTVNGESIELDVPSQIMGNRTFVPLRFIAQALGDLVCYDEETGEIEIGEESDDEESDDDDDEDDEDDEEDADDEESDDEEGQLV